MTTKTNDPKVTKFVKVALKTGKILAKGLATARELSVSDAPDTGLLQKLDTTHNKVQTLIKSNDTLVVLQIIRVCFRMYSVIGSDNRYTDLRCFRV